MNWKIVVSLCLVCACLSAIVLSWAGLEISDEIRVSLFACVVLGGLAIILFAKQGETAADNPSWVFHGVSKIVRWKMQLGLIIGLAFYGISQTIISLVGIFTLILPAMVFGWWKDSNLRHHHPAWGIPRYGMYVLGFFCVLILYFGAEFVSFIKKLFFGGAEC